MSSPGQSSRQPSVRTATVADAAELGALVVAAAARRRGIGRALLDQAARWAREAGLGTLRIRAGAARPEAHPFYEAGGCRFVKEQRVYERTV